MRSNISTEVRKVLYRIRAELRFELDSHIEAWAAEGHKTPCWVCERYKGRFHGIDRAIRAFGGRPR